MAGRILSGHAWMLRQQGRIAEAYAQVERAIRCEMPGQDQLLNYANMRQEQGRVDALWREQAAWWRASVLNTARMAWFSSDRTIGEYADEIWNVPRTKA